MINLKKSFLVPFIFFKIFSSLINASLLGETIKKIEKPNSTINWEKIISEDVKQQTKEIEWEEFNEKKDAGTDVMSALDELGFERYCCRRMFVSHIDLITEVAPFSAPRE